MRRYSHLSDDEREQIHALLAATARKAETELRSALDSLIGAGLLFVQGARPHATYLFKHALVQDAAYGTLLREQRRTLHARIVEVIETEFAEIADSQPELLARHCTEAAITEKAARLWGKAGQRSLERSALVEAITQLTRALEQLSVLPPTPLQRREQIRQQIALVNALMHAKGHASTDTKAALELARTFIERSERLGEPLEDPLLLFSALYGVWVANLVMFNGNAIRDLAAHFLDLAEKQNAVVPRMIGHRLVGASLFYTGEATEAQAHLDQALALYDGAQHGLLGTRFGYDVSVATSSYRAMVLWILGYPEAALKASECAFKEARLRTPQIGNMLVALHPGSWVQIYCGNYRAANAQADETMSLAEKKGALSWREAGRLNKGWVLALSGEPLNAIQMIRSGLASFRSNNQSFWLPLFVALLAKAHAEAGQHAEARLCIAEATTTLQTTGERWCEADICRIAGEIAAMLPERDFKSAEDYFEQALAFARQQQAKSWELRAAMSLARLWRDQGKVSEARELLAPVYGWFTEGFDTRDLKEAKALLEELGAG